MQNQLQEASSKLVEEDIRVGSIYSVRFSEDDYFYRGRVEEIRSAVRGEGNEYKIVFIDYGNSEVASRQAIYQISDKLLNIPPQAFKCRLRHLVTQGSDGSVRFAPAEKVNEKFKRLLPSRPMHCKNVYALFHPLDAKVHPSEPDYFVNLSTSLELLEKYQALNSPKILPPTIIQEESIEEVNPISRETLSPEVKDKVEKWLLDSPETDKTEPVSMAETETESPCLQMSLLELDEKPGAMVECVLEHIISPDLFYANLTHPKYKGSEVLCLSSEMGAYFKGKPFSMNANYQIGQFVAIKENDEWYRGQIEKISKETFGVFLVDFGDKLTAGKDSIHNLPPKFCTLPKFALPCRLSGIASIDGNLWYSKEATQTFRQMCAFDQLFKFRYDCNRTDLPLNVELFDSHGLNIATAMIRKKVAKPVDYGSTLANVWDPMASDFKNPFMSQFDDIAGVYQEEKRICRFFRANGRCPRGRNCQFYHVQTGSGIVTKLKVTVRRR